MPVDAVLTDAVEIARAEAEEVAGDAGAVGEHLGATEVADRLVTHRFATTLAGYRGWVWEVTLARAPRARTATVCEAHLIPADDALLAPAWLPWADRVRPGDLEASMVLPLIKDDPRVVPGYTVTEEQDADAVANWELGLGRERVLGPEGREQAAERWMAGSRGPEAASAQASASPCASCAFFVPMPGSFRLAFGVCANEWSPSDGTVVASTHGCGAHSQTDVERSGSVWPEAQPLYDTVARDQFEIPEPEPVAEETPVEEAAAGTDVATESAAEVATADAAAAEEVASGEASADAAAEDTAVAAAAEEDTASEPVVDAAESSADAVGSETADADGADSARAEETPVSEQTAVEAAEAADAHEAGESVELAQEPAAETTADAAAAETDEKPAS